MRLLSQANKSIRRRGYEYYCSGKVTSKTKIDDEIAKERLMGMMSLLILINREIQNAPANIKKIIHIKFVSIW